ncbi:DNA-3-methyladenine glycosylase 2 family protein [Actinomadura sp. HBU206391]|uniref:DNA-3-methyladenine glycosylase 2 family protein n=1 Tax=Actinomadura sp. HBU206391 TaxID=2731692 RepID=UPI002905B613|nr:AlkA N-terminal domain-containing protein [Actinomadura sp. HBU206391]
MLNFDSCYRAVTSRDARFDGRFFTAVTSTGIYCRPICPARTPARRNVRFFAAAAAAEGAGFRPCKRCRPEASPGSPDWDVRGDLIGRALRLIDDGVVDDFGVRGLARRLAVTERHLHRLFVAELGVPPLAVARNRRLRLARRLLAETHMPVTDVAFASGFGSVRQFNASMRETYGQAPSELRGVGRGFGRPATLELRLAVRRPYDSGSLLAYLAARAIPGVEKVTADRYVRTIATATGAAPAGASDAGSGTETEVGTIELIPRDDHVLLRAGAPSPRGVASLVARCRRMFDLDADPWAVDDALAADPLLAPLVSARPGLRVPGAFDGFELAVRAVLGQQVSVAGASTLTGRVVARCGTSRTPGSAGTGPSYLFPTAARLADADLSRLGLTGGRQRTLRALAAAVAAEEIDLNGGAEPGETADRLMALPGIGPWTVSYIAMRALGDPDAFPATDLGLRRAFDALGASEPALAQRAERWRPWRAYAAMHLWTSH